MLVFSILLLLHLWFCWFFCFSLEDEGCHPQGLGSHRPVSHVCVVQRWVLAAVHAGSSACWLKGPQQQPGASQSTSPGDQLPIAGADGLGHCTAWVWHSAGPYISSSVLWLYGCHLVTLLITWPVNLSWRAVNIHSMLVRLTVWRIVKGGMW